MSTTRTMLIVLVLATVMLGLTLYGAFTEQTVYACSADKDKLPPDAAKLCKQLTKGQWWHK